MSKKKTTGFVAGAAGIALLMGGATFALWNDSDSVDGGTITAGNLDVKIEKPQWFDVSPGKHQKIDDLDAFRVVPGDEIKGSFPLGLALEGDNLRAQLSLTGTEKLGGDLLDSLDFEYTVKNDKGESIASGDQPHMSVVLNSEQVPSDFVEPNFSVDVVFKFDRETPEQELVQAQAELNGVGIQLAQVRD